jgi:Sec-independent protein secretion pathway component TatC
MQGQLRQWILIAFGVFVVGAIVSLATSGGVSDIAFVVYAVALVVLIGLLIAWLVGRSRRGPTAGQP